MCKSCNKIAGHNSRTCEERLKQIQAENATTNHQADQQDDTPKRRLCSVCNKREKHNARTCPNRTEEKDEEDDEEDADREESEEAIEADETEEEDEEEEEEDGEEEEADEEIEEPSSKTKGRDRTHNQARRQASRSHGPVTRGNANNKSKTEAATTIETNAVHNLRRSTRKRT